MKHAAEPSIIKRLARWDRVETAEVVMAGVVGTKPGPMTAHKKTAPESGAVAKGGVSWVLDLRNEHRPCSRAAAGANGAPESECGYTDFMLLEHG